MKSFPWRHVWIYLFPLFRHPLLLPAEAAAFGPKVHLDVKGEILVNVSCTSLILSKGDVCFITFSKGAC